MSTVVHKVYEIQVLDVFGAVISVGAGTGHEVVLGSAILVEKSKMTSIDDFDEIRGAEVFDLD